MAYTPVLLNFLNTQAKSYLQFFQIFSIHLSLLGLTPQNLKYQKLYLSSKLTTRPTLLIIGQFHYILSNFNRIFERIMYDRMRLYWKAQPVIFVSIWFSSSSLNPASYFSYGRNNTNQCGQKTLFTWSFYWLKKNPLTLWIVIYYLIN